MWYRERMNQQSTLYEYTITLKVPGKGGLVQQVAKAHEHEIVENDMGLIVYMRLLRDGEEVGKLRGVMAWSREPVQVVRSIPLRRA